LADASYVVPRCTDAGFISRLQEICRKENAALLVPTIDTELPVLSEARESFAAAGTRVAVSAPSVVALARDKLATMRVLAAAGIATPASQSWAEFEQNPGQLREPVIAKPVGGSSSVGLIRPQRAADLLGQAGPGYLVQEMWSGREYTVNLFFDRQGTLRCAVPHLRLEVRAGEVSKGCTERLPTLLSAARKLAAALPGASGALCFQAIVNDAGACCVFEINARFGGGYPLAHRAGARFSQWLLEESFGRACTATDEWRPGVTMLRYDAAVFVE
jgi:carbamoyl-phosphate synthase large subunit